MYNPDKCHKTVSLHINKVLCTRLSINTMSLTLLRSIYHGNNITQTPQLVFHTSVIWFLRHVVHQYNIQQHNTVLILAKSTTLYTH